MRQAPRLVVDQDAERRKCAAERQRRCRARRREGEFVVRSFSVSRPVVERLITDGWTTWDELSKQPDQSAFLADLLSGFMDCYGIGMLKSSGRVIAFNNRYFEPPESDQL